MIIELANEIIEPANDRNFERGLLFPARVARRLGIESKNSYN